MSYIQNYLKPLAQENWLQRKFYEALLPQLRFLALSPYEEMQQGNGDTVIRTVPGLMNAQPTKLPAGKDATPEQNQYEHFVCTVDQYASSIDIPTNQAAMTIEGVKGYMMQKMGEQAVQCGTALNLLARNALYKAYTAGNAIAYAANGNTTTLYLNTLNGFWEIVKNGKPTTISATNPRKVTVNGVERTATAYAPVYEDYPDGPGTLTIDSAIDCPAGAVILAADRSRILRVSKTGFDSLAPSDSATLRLFRRAATELANDGVPPMPDGKYHVHCAPFVEEEIASDNEYQRLFEGNPAGYIPDGSIGTLGNLRFFPNPEVPAPNERNNGTPLDVPTRGTKLAQEYWAENTNAIGTQVQRSLVMGNQAMRTLFMDESKTMLAEAGQPIGGSNKRPQFSMVGEQIQMLASTEDIGNVRITIRPPIDRAGQQVAVTWTTTRGFAVYANLLSGKSAGRYKRAMVVESGFDPI